MKVIVQRLISGLVWIISGATVIIARTVIWPAGNILAWEATGAVMVVFGATRLLSTFLRKRDFQPETDRPTAKGH
ncbi:MAG TPA: hypothetical protein VFE98_05575 [Candidatus Bathyarchaeia archaeon]|nr:hypothetical protein [Candidatus Bathyarchaeia archaeon]